MISAETEVSLPSYSDVTSRHTLLRFRGGVWSESREGDSRLRRARLREGLGGQQEMPRL